jgi:hypothetical protein
VSNPCQKCGSPSVIRVSAKCSDMFSMRWPKGKEQNGYVPRFLNIGGGDYVEFSYCLSCGQIQGKWPVRGFEGEEEEE